MRKGSEQQQINAARKILMGGEDIKEVAKYYNVGRTTIYQWVKKHREKIENSERKTYYITEQEWREIVKEWKNSGKSQVAFAEEHGIGNTQLSKWAKKFEKERKKEKEKEPDNMSLLVILQEENGKLKKEIEALAMTNEIYKRELERLKPLGEELKRLYEKHLK